MTVDRRAASAHAVLLALSVLTVFPMVWAVVTSLKPGNEIFTLDLVSGATSLSNYVEVFQSVPFYRIMANTLVVAVVTAVATVVLSILATYALVRWEFA